jgi:hypothetical protein
VSSLWLPDVFRLGEDPSIRRVYLFLPLTFRLAGKRRVGPLTPFDLAVLLIIANVVQNAVIGPDNSLGGGLIDAASSSAQRRRRRGDVPLEPPAMGVRGVADAPDPQRARDHRRI